MKLYYQKMIMYAMLPFTIVLLSLIIWQIFYCAYKKADKSKAGARKIATIIILFFLVHPNIVQYMFNNFNCMDIDDEQRMVNDLNVICWKSEHVSYSLFVALPSLVIWGFGIPLIAWLILARNKNELGNLYTREKYGFLYNGYKKKYYFWEIVNMYRKTSIIFISVFLGIAGVITQAFVVFLVLIIFLYLNVKIKPYAFEDLNDMETFSILTSMITVYCGLYYLSDQPEIYSSSDSSVASADNGLRLNNTAKLILFMMILLSNMAFFTYWGYKMGSELKNTIRSKFKRIYLYLF